MVGTFKRCSLFNGNLSNWDTSHVTDMNNLFAVASAFNSNIGSWDTSNVTFMKGMFQLAISFSQDLSGWDVSSVVDHSFFNVGNTLLTPPNF
jgi:surface protein